jgi:hypothetical protein
MTTCPRSQIAMKDEKGSAQECMPLAGRSVPAGIALVLIVT